MPSGRLQYAENIHAVNSMTQTKQEPEAPKNPKRTVKKAPFFQNPFRKGRAYLPGFEEGPVHIAAPKPTTAKDYFGKEVAENAIVAMAKEEFWFRKDEVIDGEPRRIGYAITMLEREAVNIANRGREVYVMCMHGDKVKLGHFDEYLGTWPGNKLKDAGKEVFSTVTRDLCGKRGPDDLANFALPMNAGQKEDTSDEMLAVFLMEPARAKETYERRVGAVAAAHSSIYGRYAHPNNIPTICAYIPLVRNPNELVEVRFDFSGLVRVVKSGDRVEAFDMDGRNLMMDRRKGRGFLDAVVRTTEEQGSAAYRAEMRAMLGIGADVELEEHNTIKTPGKPPNDRVSGMGFSMAVKVDDEKALARLRELLKVTEKGLAEVLTNVFAIRGENTFFDHYGANFIVNAVERAAERYSEAFHDRLSLVKVDHQKIVMEQGDRSDIPKIWDLTDRRLKERKVKLSCARTPPTGFLDSVTPQDAAASITDARLQMDWDAGRYGLANRVVSAMAVGSDFALRELLGPDYGKLELTLKMVQSYRAIRKAEDMIATLRHAPEMLPLMGHPVAGNHEKLGKEMEAAFRHFVENEHRKHVSAELIRFIIENREVVFNAHTLNEALESSQARTIGQDGTVRSTLPSPPSPEMVKYLREEVQRVARNERALDLFVMKYAAPDAEIPAELAENFGYRLRRLIPTDRTGTTKPGLQAVRPGSRQHELGIGSQPHPEIERYIEDLAPQEQAVARVFAWVFRVRTEEIKDDSGVRIIKVAMAKLDEKRSSDLCADCPEYAPHIREIGSAVSVEVLPFIIHSAREIVREREARQMEAELAHAEPRHAARVRTLFRVAYGSYFPGDTLTAVGSAALEALHAKRKEGKGAALAAREVAIEETAHYEKSIAALDRLLALLEKKVDAKAAARARTLLKSLHGLPLDSGGEWVHHEHDEEIRNRIAGGVSEAEAVLAVALDPLGPALKHMAAVSVWVPHENEHRVVTPWNVARGAERAAMEADITGLCAAACFHGDRDAAAKRLEGCSIWFLAKGADGKPAAFAALTQTAHGAKVALSGHAGSEEAKIMLAGLKRQFRK